uniref:Chorion peroxidase n=1 Tax=Timema monikensis TaxID=170555 RepID=A0A7R9E8I2_9NEOP|nr:unnamed protein product [Timema monikensis]
MISRWCAAALLCLVSLSDASLQFAPLAAPPDGECALLLDGPGRTSAFDYNLNALRGTFNYGGQQTCITYDAVNQAYISARKRINVAAPKTHMWKPEEIATVGELLLDVSISLAKTYGLSYEDIEKGLPLIDTSKTLIREVCPPYLANVECRPGKYRRYDGLCTNLQHPTWGATNTPFTRLVGPLFADGMTAPRISVTGNQLPLPRIVSRTVHPDEGFHDHAGTVMVVAWGQFMDHDYTLTGTPLDPLNRNEPEECCNRPPHLKNPYCLEIEIPADDYFYSLFGLRCQDFVRGFPAVRPGCRLGFKHLRAGYGGLMRMNPVFAEYGLKDLLPLKLDIPDEGCTRPNRSMYCFEGGEIRVNEQLVLTCMHTLMAREHNRVASGLGQINPHWDDETLYQETRRIVVAEIQHITYNEFLPILLGKEVMDKFGLLTNKESYLRFLFPSLLLVFRCMMEITGTLVIRHVSVLDFTYHSHGGRLVLEHDALPRLVDGYWDGYDPNVNPNVIDAFAAAAFRFGHSLLPTAIERWSKAHKFIASRRLSDLIRQPFDLYRAGVLDEYFMGLMNQVAQAMDDSVTQEVTNHLFKKPGARFGMDLAAFNMQRGREFGLPGYMDFRKFCGLPGADTFDELFGSMSNETIRRYASIYEHPSDVDLWSGGVSERPLPGSMVGPTFACVIATQFSYSRRGDRFWYENGNQPSSFTPATPKWVVLLDFKVDPVFTCGVGNTRGSPRKPTYAFPPLPLLTHTMALGFAGHAACVAYSPEQLQEIRKQKLSRVICDNTDLMDTIQVYPMVLPDHEILLYNPRSTLYNPRLCASCYSNPRVPCRSGILPSMDLSKWADIPAAPAFVFDPLGKK